jgi:hypothetical protein
MNREDWRRLFAAAGLLLLVLWLVGHCAGCTPNLARPAAYKFELEECTRHATNCEESIACENRTRARYGREPRTGGCTP